LNEKATALVATGRRQGKVWLSCDLFSSPFKSSLVRGGRLTQGAGTIQFPLGQRGRQLKRQRSLSCPGVVLRSRESLLRLIIFSNRARSWRSTFVNQLPTPAGVWRSGVEAVLRLSFRLRLQRDGQ
jgi:hypothetical protein